MAETSYINPETIFNFHVIPATTKLHDSEIITLVWDITVGNNQNQVAKICFFKSLGSIMAVWDILVDSTDNDTKSIFHFDGSTNPSFIFDGLLNPLDLHEYHPWESVTLGIKSVAVLKAIQGNLQFQSGNSAALLNPAGSQFRSGGNSVDKDDNGNDGGKSNGNDGKGGGDGNGDGGNGVGDGHGNGGNDGGDGSNDAGNGNAAANIKIHRLDLNHECIEIIRTNIVADECAHWWGFALAIYSVWLQQNPDQYHTAAYEDVNPSTCWPGCVVSVGQVAEDGSWEIYDWEKLKFSAVRKLIRDVAVFEIA